MSDTLDKAVEQLRADARSGASELVGAGLEILRRALEEGPQRRDEVARAVGEAQPSMAPLWNAALCAVREGRDAGALDRFERRWRRAQAAVVRVAADALRPTGRDGLHVITCSFSGTVLACLLAMSPRDRLRVSCADGRPALEGRRLAAALAAEGIRVDVFSDAAIGEALRKTRGEQRVVLVGSDAVTPAFFLNKCGTGMLAVAAERHGVPVYAVATRDKCLDERAARLLRIVDHDPAEIWNDAPGGVRVRNRYFEQVPIDGLSALITEAGVLAADMVGEACRASSAEVADEDIGSLSRA